MTIWPGPWAAFYGSAVGDAQPTESQSRPAAHAAAEKSAILGKKSSVGIYTNAQIS
jgi:hypothetical protein